MVDANVLANRYSSLSLSRSVVERVARGDLNSLLINLSNFRDHFNKINSNCTMILRAAYAGIAAESSCPCLVILSHTFSASCQDKFLCSRAVNWIGENQVGEMI